MKVAEIPKQATDLDWSQTLLTAEKHLSHGRIAAAIDEYRKLVDWDPADLQVLNTLGDLYVRVGLNRQATRIFSRVAEAYRKEGFIPRAIALLKKLLRIDPTDLEAAARLAECYQAQGLRGEAVRQYAEVADAYERAGRGIKALDVYQRIAEIDSSNTSLLTTLGERWLSEGMEQQAHTSFQAAGDEFFKQGDYEHALAAYLKAQATHPDEHKTLAAIASTCAMQGRAESAIPVLLESLARNPGDAEMYGVLGSAYLTAGLLEDAEHAFQDQLALDSGAYHNLLNLGEKFLECGAVDRAVGQIDRFVDTLIANRREKDAIDFLHKALDSNPEHLASLRTLALIFRRVREGFNLVRTLNALADVAMRQGSRDEAIKALEELCLLEPHETAHGDRLRDLGVEAPALPCTVYSATALVRRHKEYEDDARRNVLGIAGALSKRGQTEDAAALLRRALRTEPDNVEARIALKNIYASVGSFDLAANEYLQIGRIRQSGKTLASDSREFAQAPVIPKLIPASAHIALSAASTDFELIPKANRRRVKRLSRRVPLVVIYDTGGWREFTETIDVGEEGLRIRLSHPVAPMTVLGILIDTAKWPETFSRHPSVNAQQAIVRYCKQRPGESNIVGVELWPIPEQMSNATLSFEQFTDHLSAVSM